MLYSVESFNDLNLLDSVSFYEMAICNSVKLIPYLYEWKYDKTKRTWIIYLSTKIELKIFLKNLY